MSIRGNRLIEAYEDTHSKVSKYLDKRDVSMSKSKSDHQIKNSLIGVAIGAPTGFLLGHKEGMPGSGAVIGGLMGGAYGVYGGGKQWDRVYGQKTKEEKTKDALKGFDDALALFRKHEVTGIPRNRISEWRGIVKQHEDSYNGGHNAFFDLFNEWVDTEPDGRAWKIKNDKKG